MSVRSASLLWARVAVLVVGLGMWEVLARFVVKSTLLSPPSQVVHALCTQILVTPEVLKALWTTFYELALAFVLAVLIGALVGVLVGLDPRARRTTYPLVLMLYAVPQVTVLPLFVMYFGLGPASKVAFGFTHGIFPIIVNVVAGMQSIPPILLRSVRSMGASRSQVLRHVVLPHLVPSFFAGMRLAMAMTLLGVVLAELYGSIEGVGYFAQLYAETFDSAPLFALIAMLALMAVLLNEIVRRAELRFGRHQR
jgi:NitT/TauT family transport system permease protein